MGVTTTKTNKPFNPRAQDQSPKGFNRAKLYSGKALDFDGVNDYVDIGQNLGFINTGDFTFLANAKFDVLSGDEPIMGQGSGSTGNAALALVNSLGKLRFAFYGDDLDWDEPIQTGKWYSLAFTFNRTTKARSIYVNGQLAVSDVTTLTPNATGNTFVIGKVPYLSTYADAQITGVKAFNTALTAAQVADLYNNPEKVVPTGVDNTALKLWLPMMEGAGTTAYDGSGNGNHGTISGATYVNGVGAPVSQSAVMDWNKGTNLVPYSEDLSQWTINNVVVTTNATTAPDGSSNADEVENDANNSIHRVYRICGANSSTNDVAFSVYLKYKDHQYVSFGPTDDSIYRGQFVVDLINGTITDTYTDNANVVSSSLTNVGNGWYKLEGVITPTTAWNNNLYAFVVLLGGSTFSSGPVSSVGTSVYVWGAQVEYASINGPYIPTLSTAQTSDVLLPQGLTSGRDITGVNLFENVRKQGALNLDGNSWAEVHDNASLDVTTAVTLEAWVQNSDEDNKGILGRWFAGTACYMLYKPAADNNFNFYINANYVTSGTVTARDWHHVVGVYDGATKKIYVNGVEEGSSAETATINTSSDPIEIGRFFGGPDTRTLANQLAQPRIYNRALTAEEVQRNYNAGKNTYTN